MIELQLYTKDGDPERGFKLSESAGDLKVLYIHDGDTFTIPEDLVFPIYESLQGIVNNKMKRCLESSSSQIG